MKNRILLTISAIFILALGIVAFAFNQSNDLSKTAAPDSCAMKGMAAHAGENQTKTSCCDKEDCCCKSGTCPMKKQGETGPNSCCSNCCGDACPMKNKQAENISVSSGESCDKMRS